MLSVKGHIAMIKNIVKEKKAYLPPSIEIVSLREQMPLVAYSGGEFNMNEPEEKKYFA